MAVGHHLGDRGHVIERSQNVRSGEREERQNFIGLTENDGASFNDEWMRATGNQHDRARRHLVDGQRDGERHYSQKALPEAGSRHHRQQQQQQQHPRDQMLREK